MDNWLTKLGFDNTFYKEYLPNAKQNIIAKVTAEHKGSYLISTHDGEHMAVVTGKNMLLATKREHYPAVGDWVFIKNTNDDNKVIESILPRKTALYKKYGNKNERQLIASNIDVAFIVGAVGRDLNLNRYERYIVLVRGGGIRPVLVLNKSDLVIETELQTMIANIKNRFSGVDVYATSTEQMLGLEKLSNQIKPGLTYCFLGSSGVGKSSIINKLLNKELISTQPIGSKSGRGKHITTTRQIYFMQNGGLLVDNPGSREVGISEDASGLKLTYNSIEELSINCKFKDCSHTSEPGCAILKAIEKQEIDRDLYQNYLKLNKEAEFYELTSHEKRQKNKQFGKFIKKAKKELKIYKDPL
jgi:ribosome biogenesis GTPase / thiamine phosphate phosphatase